MVEPTKLKRAGVGLRAIDRERVCPGWTLFAVREGDAGVVYLIDLDGEVRHTWRLPHPPGLSGYLTEAGTLFYNTRVLEEADRFIARQPWKGGGAMEVTWSGRVLWQITHPDHHHDGTKLRNGNVLLLGLGVVPPELAARVQGGRPGSEHEGTMFGDTLIEMTTAGETVWEWRSWEHLDPALDRLPSGLEDRAEWTHANSVEELPDGNLLVSFRNLSTVAIVDRRTGAIVWRLGSPPLAHQHAPTRLPNGNFLIFDNGTHRLDTFTPYSRVIEVDPATRAIVWSYAETPPMNFFSPFISNARRLPNGNTLICEGNFGRFFEVTPDGAVVWEYVNPHFRTEAHLNGREINNVFRVYRYTEAEIARARATG